MHKVFSVLGSLKHLKRKRPDLILGVTGCVAQQEGAKLLKQVPYLDLVIGPRAIEDFTRAFAGRGPGKAPGPHPQREPHPGP